MSQTLQILYQNTSLKFQASETIEIKTEKPITFINVGTTTKQSNDGITDTPFYYDVPMSLFGKNARQALKQIKTFKDIKFDQKKHPYLAETQNILKGVFVCEKVGKSYQVTSEQMILDDKNLLLKCESRDPESLSRTFEQQIHYDTTLYYASDMYDITNDVLTTDVTYMNSDIPFFCLFPLFITQNSFILRQDDSSPIKRVVLSPLTLVLPFLSNFSVFKCFPERCVPSLDTMTEYLLSYSLGDLLLKLKSTFPKRKNDHINDLLDQTVRILQDSENTLLMSLKSPFFYQANTYKKIKEVDIDSLGIRPCIKEAGRGAVGTIFQSMCRKYAIKVCKAEYEEFTLREVRVLKMLNHPNILKFVAYGSNTLITEWCYYGSIDDFMKVKRFENQVLPPNYFLHVVSQFNAGYDYLYTNVQMVHRDIKYNNIFITIDPSLGSKEPENLVVKIADFNTTRVVSDEMHTKIGTPQFMAQEIYKGKYGTKAEVYAIGLFLYYLLAGTLPRCCSNSSIGETVPVSFVTGIKRVNTFLYSQMEILIQKMVEPREIYRIGWEDYLTAFNSIQKKCNIF
ncbi:serine-threonine protein kinase, putative [Entamoeba invadens IP1]|uniref:Serine-threonine protein kinase, putative n=1 Tax=Entamoeba invadens IP1 TaxID=370355 RepID=A0A0A1TVZ7_ENTIV|nr:serine-threonine protein kinase, putative [Entamoeba invadens IP1]ELP84694.1 serine-threonine protein kinase, putative [Entamoeba invadens IP1]|eukprot:XP_004184040.1 serine-threonine protein kinase, putative [Entamoeba invadens IP1]